MIKVQGRKILKGSFIGFENDNLVETRHFEITDESLFDFDFKLDMKHTDGVNTIDLPKEYKENSIILTWEVRKEHLPAGILYIQLRAFNESGQVWHSEQKMLRVPESINATNYFPSPLPSEFEQMEQRVTAIQADVTAKHGEVEADRAEVAGNTQTILEKSGEAAGSAAAALLSEQHAKTSEDNAKDHADEAERQADIARNNILNGVAAHNESEESHPYVLSEMVRIEAIARGRASSLTFDTKQQLLDWIASDYERPDGKTVADLNVGDNLYILDIDVPDYWWTGTDISELEAQAVNLGDYYTKTEVDARLPIVIEQSDYDEVVDLGQVIAGRIYYVVPDGALGDGDD